MCTALPHNQSSCYISLSIWHSSEPACAHQMDEHVIWWCRNIRWGIQFKWSVWIFSVLSDSINALKRSCSNPCRVTPIWLSKLGHHWDQLIACRLLGADALSKPMITYRLQNGDHFIRDSVCWCVIYSCQTTGIFFPFHEPQNSNCISINNVEKTYICLCWCWKLEKWPSIYHVLGLWLHWIFFSVHFLFTYGMLH